ncbi:MAG TPA: alpha/beta hydrolase [Kofleriaceae bacterium]|nr:alpha/beta hydrolase [Kofleriaceae bacterium]
MDSKTLSDKLGVPETTGARPSGNPIRRSLERFRKQVAGRATARITSTALGGLSSVARLHPRADPTRHHVQVIRDVPYVEGPAGLPEHTLDIYRPTVKRGPWPIVLYVHGGGFRLLSKDTHWVMGLLFARFGYLVFNISYRLAPKHPYPAALEDTCAAYQWVVENAAKYGGDPSRLVVAGESAGGNLVSALTVATCFPRPEPFARKVFDLGVVPTATLPFCAILQVSDTERFNLRRKLPFWVDTVLRDVGFSYLGTADPLGPGGLGLADPLLVVESGEQAARPLPPHFLPVGTRDPLLDDSRRMAAALDARGVPCEARYYPGELHAFQAMVFRKPAQRCWRDTFAFLDRYVPSDAAQPAVAESVDDEAADAATG